MSVSYIKAWKHSRKGNVNSINARLVLAGAQVVDITNEQGVVIAR